MEYFHIFSSGLIVTLSTVFVFFLKKYLEFKDSQISKAVPIDKFGKYDLSGKVIILTGATDGIGKEMARLLSSFNPKRLIIPARNKQKGINLLNYIKNKNGSSDNVEIWDIDLADLQSVVDFADKFIREVGELHMLFNNAGLFNLDNIRTKDNLESHLQVNHLAPFLLTIKLLDTLKKSATPDSPSKISFTSSVTNHYYNLDMDDLLFKNTKKLHYNYYYTKIMNIMISNEIAHRYQNSNITSSSAHPGLINTQMIKSNDSLIGKIIIKFVKYHTESWEQGAVNMLYPVLSSNINDNGNYFDKCVEREPNKITLDEEMREILWDFSVDLLTEKGYFQK
ncbi:retinol dehydrogenase 12-like protein [Rhizophagus clarus]|uniref:Retinol dehydrogenase 12-like protein n=1 Tax=Rhizophagus clarus TaxID=94130 RepID=A0A8H3MDN2_9GLOM|nr:retinol dehydrogenase 12-like protein [Rhizophagus clarus]